MESNDGFVLKIKAIMDYYGLSANAMSNSIGVAQATFYKQITGKSSISASIIRLILVSFPEISAEWLLRDEGEMIRNETSLNVDIRGTGVTKKVAELVANLSEVLSECDKENDSLRKEIKRLSEENYILKRK